MLDVEDPVRRKVIAQRRETYNKRRTKRAKKTKDKTVRISTNAMREQVDRSSNVVIEPPPTQGESEESEDEEEDEEKAVEEDKEDQAESEDEKEDDTEEKEEEAVPTNSRGRPIIRPTRDGAPITQGSTWRRNNW